MPLSWNEIRNRAHEFSKRWENEASEDVEAKPFWAEFFSVFGIDRKRTAVEACYRKAAFVSDAQRVEFLFERYQQLTSLLPTKAIKNRSRTQKG